MFNITYDMNGRGSIPEDALKTFTIEDEYTPPVPDEVEGFTFVEWRPKKIMAGTLGDFNFIAQWEKIVEENHHRQ